MKEKRVEKPGQVEQVWKTDGLRSSHLSFSQEELQVSAAQDAVVLDVVREIHGAGAVHRPVDFHVAMDDIQVLPLVLEQTQRTETDTF